MASDKLYKYPPDWELTQKSLKEIMSYCPETGEFRWKVKSNPRITVGEVISSSTKDGYKQASIKRKRYYLHRLAFLYIKGNTPACFVDHIDGDRKNNRWANLREVTVLESNRNLGKPRTNTSGTVGVAWHKAAGKWSAQINVNGVSKYLGVFSDKDEAILARKQAEVALGFHKNHGRVVNG